MRTLRVNIAVGGHWIEEIEIPILDDNTTLDELNEIAAEAVNDLVHFDWEVIDE